MTPTLDTAAIRRRFEQAIIGIRADGTMAVLVPFAEGCDSVFDLVDGYEHYTEQFSDEFPTLIRPGDKCEGYRRCRNTHGDPRFLPCVYLGYSGRKDYPFVVKHEYQDVFSHISPLPAAETKPEADDEAREQPDPHCAKCPVYMQHRCCGETVDGKTLYNHLDDKLKPEAETGQHFNALEYWLTHGLKREQEWDKIRQIFRNALGDNPGCPFCLSYISETEPNPLLTRLTAAEQELAAIRAEMEQVQK